MAREGTSAAKSRTAPAADDRRKPDAPTDLTKPSWAYTFKKAFTEFGRDQCTDLAAALTYYAVLALFPALLALVSLLGVFGQGESTTDAMLEMIRQMGQGNAADQLRGPISQMTQANAAGFAFVFGILGALWSASGYVGAFGRAMNRVYQIDEGRPFWKLRPLQLLITLAGVLLVALVLVGLVISGPVARSVGDLMGLGSAAVTAWNIAKWPVILLIVVVLVALLYHATPNIRQPKFRWISVGAAIAIITWVVASAAFGFYVSNFGNYNKTYGSLAGVIVFLLWLWLTNLALLFGAEVDSELERSRELQAGIEAEETLQLPPRDTRGSDKRAEKLEERIAEGRTLRERAHKRREGDAGGDARRERG
jgi:membrane protein